jgi:Ni,Fe-hydrogenase III small subunit
MISSWLYWLSNFVDGIRALLGRGLYTETHPKASKQSLCIRHIDGGSSNAAELELTALTNPIYDIEQYGIRFVASPRHADLLLITGPLTWSMVGPALAAFRAMPNPKRVVTVGDCAGFADPVDGSLSLFAASYAVAALPDEMKEAIVAHIPGNPPGPAAIIDALLSLNLADNQPSA